LVVPFLAQDPAEPGQWLAVDTVELRQLPVTRRWKVEFEVISDLGFTELPPDGGDASARRWSTAAVQYFIPAGMRTDLASVPPFLWGVIASYGRQTLPALLHDMLNFAAAQPGQPIAYRHRACREADRLFRTTLAASGSGVLRRWLMWSAVRVFRHPEVVVSFVVTAAAVAAAAIGTWGWWVAAVGGIALLAFTAAAAVERDRSVEAQGEYTSARFVPAAWFSMLGAVGVAAIGALPIGAVGAVTFVLELVVGLGERSTDKRPDVTVQAV
jgi:hypothetical protein